jgi:hypothetical protein
MSTPTRRLPEGQWEREACSAHGKSGIAVAMKVLQ